LLTYIDRGKSAKLNELTFFIVVAVLLLILMIASAFAFLSIAGGVAFLLGSGYIIFLAAYIFQRLTKEKKDIPQWYFTVNRFLSFVVIVAGFAVQLFDPKDVGGFVGISYTMAALLVFTWAFGVFTLVKDLSERMHRPVYISPNIIPTFKYNSETNRLDNYI
jgi:amino acid transporter